MDWGVGRYERTAEQLEPAARALVAQATPAPGERVVDVGCGTGNATLLAAARGAQVTGVDPAPRLLEVARERAAAANVEATFAAGDAAALPLADGDADVVLSCFGVIFAPDAAAAAAELARVTAPRGRIALTAWLPEGTIREAIGLARRASAPPGSANDGPPFAWHDAAALSELFGPFGFTFESTVHAVAFTAASAAGYLDGELADHPLWVAGRERIEPLRDDILAVLEAGNEDDAAFRVTSRYAIATGARA